MGPHPLPSVVVEQVVLRGAADALSIFERLMAHVLWSGSAEGEPCFHAGTQLAVADSLRKSYEYTHDLISSYIDHKLAIYLELHNSPDHFQK